MTNREKIYNTAKDCLGQSFATNAQLGCMETVNAIVKKALGYEVGGGASTQAAYTELQSSTNFIQVDSPLEGDIILSPTGQGNYPHGHVGIVARYGILSNSSEDGKLHEAYTLSTWNDYFHTKGGFPVYFFRAVDVLTITTGVDATDAPRPYKAELVSIFHTFLAALGVAVGANLGTLDISHLSKEVLISFIVAVLRSALKAVWNKYITRT